MEKLMQVTEKPVRARRVYLNDDDIDKIMKEEIALMKAKGGGKKEWNENKKMLRHNYILHLIRRGYSRAQIIAELMERWDVSWTAINQYYNSCLEYLGELCVGEDIGKVKKKQLERLEAQMQECIDRGNYTNAARYNDMINKIEGLYTENQNITVDGDIKFDFE